MDLSFWNKKRVFLTGHTGFKGSWLTRVLLNAGAEITGYSLAPPSDENLYSICKFQDHIYSVIGDIRDDKLISKIFSDADPEIVIHMAAQPIVRESYKNPAYTYEVNVMGTVQILECVRKSKGVKSFLNVTTDKVYNNREWPWGYREIDSLDGYDPYSNSKSCSELVTHSYRRSFFSDHRVAISTVRAGNVIGGGDFACDRIIPDCVRAAHDKKNIVVRNPDAVRPYQHVLEPLSAYLLICQKQYEDSSFQGNYNVGPDQCDCVTTGELVTLFCAAWGDGMGWEFQPDRGPHESHYLKLDCSKILSELQWRPSWHIDQAVRETVEWSKVYIAGGSVNDVMDLQIKKYFR